MNKDIQSIQTYLMNRLEKLNDDNYMKENLKDEISRSNTVSNTALAYIKVVDLQLRIDGLSTKERQTIKRVSK